MTQINWRKVIILTGIIGGVLIVGFLSFNFFYNWRIKTIEKEWEKPEYPGGLSAEDLRKISVPEPGQEFEEGIAVPKEAVESAPQSESKLRIFEVKGEKGTIFPVSFRAYQNDVINIKLFALDGAYDFFLEGYNLQMKVNKGEIRTIEFQALNPGVYNFYCSLCQTKDKPAGKVIVMPK